ncbi:FAD-binding oxidoreductase [Kutzneria buriramensis]|uniref:NAD(P)/FAD-dependent oxidoreductase n=1 Tax=Kutzneria buriramensis TaxID=1045776 RepID=UPI001B881989|nr:FAD-binding oxidoreductase [Kutzneria buriramensis]
MVVGAGVIGAACAEALSAAGATVTVVDRSGPAAGTTGAGEGNVLVSDKEPGPELELAQAARRQLPELLAKLADELGPELSDVEWQPKGGLVVATTDPRPLRDFAERQRTAGVTAHEITPEQAFELEPNLTREITTAVHYPEDGQVQPVLLATTLLSAVRQRGGRLLSGVTATGATKSALVTDSGTIACDHIVNACGPWAGDFASKLGAPLPVLPRRGLILVTTPVADLVRHKVYDADYVGAVASGDADLQTSTVVESTPAGTVLIGSSRQRVGFDETIQVDVLRELARKAIRLFPRLAGVNVMRAYGGFRPYTPDHLPVVGADPRVPGLWHATGHEGAGIGLAVATGRLLAELMTGQEPHVDPKPFRVDRPGLAA